MALTPLPPQPDVAVSVRESTDVATARRAAATLAEKLNFNEEDAGAVAILATEAASNMIKHGGGGELIVAEVFSGDDAAIQILAMDKGKGMTSVARSFEDGYSTASSQGTGLGAIARMADAYDLYSAPEKGTVLMARRGRPRKPSPDALEIGAIVVPYPGERECGDVWFVDRAPARIRFALADGLGHGIFAAEASRTAVLHEGSRRGTPAESIESIHLALRSTRGAAMSVADIELNAQRAAFAGAGNVSGAIVMQGSKRQMVTVNGTLGHQIGRINQYGYPFPRGATLVMHSDGLSANWSLDKYPGLIRKHPSVIAGVLYRDFRRTRDDSAVVVAREASR